MKERVLFIDYLKGISIIGVILIHLSLFLTSEDANYLPFTILDTFFRFAVPVFIGLLGYLTLTRYTTVINWKSFYKTKVFVLYVPFFVWSFVYSITPSVFQMYNKDDLSIVQIVLGDAGVQLYFMVAYGGFLILTPLIVKVLKSKYLIPISIFMISIHLVWLCVLELYLLGVTSFNYIGSNIVYFLANGKLFLHWLSFYFVGILIAYYQKPIVTFIMDRKGAVKVVFLLSFLFQLFLSGYYVAVHPFHIYYSPVLILVATSGFILCTTFYFWIEKSEVNRFISFFGRNSLSIYLSHIFFFEIFYYLFFGFDKSTVTLLLLFVFTIIGCVMYIPIHNSVFMKVPIFNVRNSKVQSR